MSDRKEIDARLTGSPVEVAPFLLGWYITHDAVTVRITEVEAYGGADDPGSHAYGGPTPRTTAMFGPAGHLYCYLSYGIHVCANVTVGPAGTPGAVLLRAGAVTSGADLARARAPRRTERDLARGPGRLGQVLGLSLHQDGSALDLPPLSLRSGPRTAGESVVCGPRVGLRRAANRPWRFWLVGEPTVSPYRRSPGATPAPR